MSEVKSLDEALKIVNENGYEIENLPKIYRTNKKVIYCALMNSPEAISLLDEELLDNEGFIIEAMGVNPNIFKYLDLKYQDNKKIVLMAVDYDGCLLKYAGSYSRNDVECIEAALINNKDAIEFIGHSFNRHKSLIVDKALYYRDIARNKERIRLKEEEIKNCLLENKKYYNEINKINYRLRKKKNK